MVAKADLPFLPLQDFVLLERLPKDELPSGIVLPDQSSMDPGKARIIAVGPGKRSVYNQQIMPVDLRVGQIVYLLQAPMTIPAGEVNLHGRTYLLQRAEFLVAAYNE